jgi:hypothetical protein
MDIIRGELIVIEFTIWHQQFMSTLQVDWLVSPLTQHQQFIECLSNLAHGRMSLLFRIDGWIEFEQVIFIQVHAEDTSKYMWTSDAMATGAPYLQIQCSIQSKYGRLKTPRGCDQGEFAMSSLHDLIIVLDTLWGDMHGVLFLGKSEKLLFLAILFFGEWSNCIFDFIFEDPIGGFAYGVSFIGFEDELFLAGD